MIVLFAVTGLVGLYWGAAALVTDGSGGLVAAAVLAAFLPVAWGLAVRHRWSRPAGMALCGAVLAVLVVIATLVLLPGPIDATFITESGDDPVSDAAILAVVLPAVVIFAMAFGTLTRSRMTAERPSS